MFPTSLYVLQQLVNLDRDDFVKYVVCPNCSSLYDPGDCTQQIGGRIVAECCMHKAFIRRVREQGNVERGPTLPTSVSIGDSEKLQMGLSVIFMMAKYGRIF